MLENAQHWEDLGYRVASGDFVQGSEIDIERPEENSLPLSSSAYSINEIVSVQSFSKMRSEAEYVADSIKLDVADGLRLDDILVVSVDDRNSKNYLRSIAQELRQRDIAAHDIHSDAMGLVDFYAEDKVTLSTVHKAKGNEAFMVYVVGIDAIFDPYPSVRERNMLFTAMTRAKGWVRLSGIGEGAERCKLEIDRAIANFPSLRFTYPSPEQLNVMKRDLADDSVRKLEAQRLMERLVEEFGVSAEELGLFVKDKAEKTTRKQKKIDDD